MDSAGLHDGLHAGRGYLRVSVGYLIGLFSEGQCLPLEVSREHLWAEGETRNRESYLVILQTS